ncbi:PHD-finger domain-containing protein [Zalerion maritima]|uniref:PHD-finger domain-containing protein n=1 Tax=Zalerion maritima TaxID=339359 RepID=A0AAD5WQP1_9PEZI|nr:PHD-finger domain-containing protein [Zalerion maritima]
MTDKLPPLSTQIAPPSQFSAVPLPIGISAIPSVPKAEAVEEEEPYTIKCICTFTGDDGNTIYCETCDSWQHIECYYPDSVENALREDFAHSCVDCKPRPVDKQKAILRQRRRLEAGAAASQSTKTSVIEELAIDKKPKRPPQKNRKKPKQPPADIQTNGGHASSGHDHARHTLSHDHPNAPPPKKSKTSHKASHSVSSQAPKRSPSYGTTRPGHPPSPATTPPDVPIDSDLYTPTHGFIEAYKEQTVTPIASNLFAALNVSATLAAWPRDAKKMKAETGFEPKDVFRPTPPRTPCHQLKVEQKTISISGDSVVNLRYLTTPAAISKEEPLVELNGSIIFQKDYCASPENRWDKLTFPLPFVFFHDALPLCIDTRVEGSMARYVRRSCRPTARLETYLDPSNTALYHFMLIADRDINPNEQITLPWDFRLPKETQLRWRKLLGLDLDEEDHGKAVEPQSEQDLITLRTFIPSLLGEYGGCACELGRDCAFARFNRNWNGKMHAPSKPTAPKKRSRTKQTKTQATTSPASTGNATNSRAPSEGRPDDVPEQDRQSTSGSGRSKPPSRDRTPAPGHQPSLETYGMLTAEPTEREKRKAAAFEENIRRTEDQKPKKKKARVSDGTTGSSTKTKSTKRGSMSHASSATSATVGRHYIDAATSRSKSNSPAGTSKPKDLKQAKSETAREAKSTQTPRPLILASKPVYVDQSTQTDPVVEWYQQKQDPQQPRRRVVSLAKRLLQNRHRQLAEQNAQDPLPPKVNSTSVEIVEPPKPNDKSESAAEKPSPTSNPPPTTQTEPVPVAKSVNVPTTDIDMPDAIAATLASAKSPVPSASNQCQAPGPTNRAKGTELRVQMPPVPAFNGPSSATSTPLSATGSVKSPFSATTSLPSPFGPSGVNGIAHPSPQRKKLSLSDYRKSRNITSTAGKSTSGLSTASRVPPSQDDPKVAAGQENAHISAVKVSDAKSS